MLPGWIRDLDELLRGDRTRGDLMRGGGDRLPLRVFVPAAVALGATYGFFMGWYAVSVRMGGTEGIGPGVMQLIASTVKLPALFLLTLVVTFPSLYVFNALVGYRMTFGAAMRVLVAAVVVNLAVGASLGPILAFFTLSTTSYPFMVVLNVVLLGIAGFVSLGFLRRTLRNQMVLDRWEEAARDERGGDLQGPGEAQGAIAVPAPRQPEGRQPARSPMRDDGQGAANLVFQIWVVIYALVGAQMGWLLRPFIGRPELPFEWFRPREGNFFLALMGHLRRLMGL